MANFNFSGLDKKFKTGGQDYGYLINAIDIKKAQLEADGKLSPGDYDVLTNMAQDAYSHPGLTPAQRSDISVKISTFKSQKSQTALGDNSNLSQVKGDIADSLAQYSIQFAGNPAGYLQAKAALISANITQLSAAIDNLDGSGQDSTGHAAELTSLMNEYNDTTQALHDVKGYDGKSAPKSDYAAYLVTNSKGEVVDMKIDRSGALSGYNQTNAVYGGLPVFGKPVVVGGNKTFRLGSDTYTAPDIVQPSADGTMKPSVLFSSKSQVNPSGRFDIATAGYAQVDPSTVRAQSVVPQGSWVKGSGGMLYQANGDGTYKKYVNADPAKLGISPNDIITLPKSLTASIAAKATQTVDGSVAPAPVNTTLAPAAAPATPGAGATPNPFRLPPTPDGPMDRIPTATSPAPLGRPQTGTPAPGGAPTQQSAVGKTLSAAGGFLGKVFGGLGFGSGQ